ncbi:MAG: hypothetical protein KGJ09_09425 [Candidatus Omnitrophica bacterium]|nr:hypothetical protein [Candidatus Omnitrophota bacterium]MDE2215238.1 hypothetical protein [Candidatus Omnitrophota bacterium]MDE2231027.1 hypothetical protein [Candidatus Omnitrophota bacterium]
MNISKLDAARRQLDSAITLYFRNGDPISIHTLTAAAHQILMDLGKKEGIKSVFKECSLMFISEEKHKEYLKLINKAENFFKHANQDPNELLDFNPETTDFFLIDAVEMYMQLTKETPEDMGILRAWILINYPDFLTQEIRIKSMQLNVASVKEKGKQKFYQDFKLALIEGLI